MRRRVFVGGPDAEIPRVGLLSRTHPRLRVAAELVEWLWLRVGTQQIALPLKVKLHLIADFVLDSFEAHGRVEAPGSKNVGPNRERNAGETHGCDGGTVMRTRQGGLGGYGCFLRPIGAAIPSMLTVFLSCW